VVSGVLNVARWYGPMPFFFTAAHYWTGWLAVGALLLHVAVQLPVVRRSLAPPTPAGETAAEPELIGKAKEEEVTEEAAAAGEKVAEKAGEKAGAKAGEKVGAKAAAAPAAEAKEDKKEGKEAKDTKGEKKK